MVNRVHRGDHSQQDLGSANVARCFMTPNVLLARLQGEAISGPSFGIVRNADQASRHVAFVLIARGEVSGVLSAEAEGNAQSLCAADCHIRAKFPRRFQQRECENVGRDEARRLHALVADARTQKLLRAR